jgi:plasmid stabilization system protein ParE
MAAGFAVNIAPRALADVAAVARWWQKNRLGAPRLFQQELDAALCAIAERPEIGPRIPLRRYPNARSYVLQRTGYVVLYNVDPETMQITVVRVRHGKRRPLKRR